MWNRVSSLKRSLGSIGLMLALATVLPGCFAHARGEMVYDYDAEYVETVPPRIERYPRTYYHGRPAYLVDGRWYYNSNRRWVVFRDEPVELREYRVRRAPAYVAGPRHARSGYSQPLSIRRDSDRRYVQEKRAERRHVDARRADARRADARRAERRHADERRAEQRRADERRAERRHADERRAEQRRADERRAERRHADERRDKERRADRNRPADRRDQAARGRDRNRRDRRDESNDRRRSRDD
jgi:hypothetical protein